MISIEDWQKEYIMSQREFEQEGRSHAEEYMYSLNPLTKLILENIWLTKQSARYEAAWAYLRNSRPGEQNGSNK